MSNIFRRFHPLFDASPDGLTETHVVEVKCPLLEKTVLNYITTGGELCNKPCAPFQLQEEVRVISI